MTVRNNARQVLNKAGLEALTTVVSTMVRVNEDIYQSYEHPGEQDGKRQSGTRLLFAAGQVVPKSAIDALFQLGTFTSVTPNTGALAGGDDIEIRGTNLFGATGVTIGGVAATDLKVVNSGMITCTTPAGTAGAKNIVITDDGGNITANNAFTYA